MKIRILLADDQTILRSGIRSMFANVSGYEIVGEAMDGLSAVAIAKQLKPDVVIMDITMPGLNGIDAAKQISIELPTTRIVILSVHSDRRFIEKAIASGAMAYLRKDCEFDEILIAISSALEGKLYVSTFPEGNQGPVTELKSKEIESGNELTLRERQILRFIAQGKTTKEISAELYLGVKSIERYRQIIMDKLNIHNIAELTRYAISEGLIPLD